MSTTIIANPEAMLNLPVRVQEAIIAKCEGFAFGPKPQTIQAMFPIDGQSVRVKRQHDLQSFTVTLEGGEE